jgi:hypothetical protein
MTAIPLFSKVQASIASSPVSVAHQLQQWLARGRGEVFTVTTTLTPELARLLLAANEDNRTVRLTTRGTRGVSAYAAMMRRGEWMLNGSTLVVASNGQLNDGQHRCLACIEADVAIPVQIAFGVERDTRCTLDQGAARSPGDVLKLIEPSLTDANVLATYLQFRFSLAAGRNFSFQTTPDEIRDAFQMYPDGKEHIAAVQAYARRMRLSVGYIAGAHGLCAEANPTKAKAFIEAVSTGVGIPDKSSPEKRLRDIYESNKGARGSALFRDAQAALYVKAFNIFARGKLGPVTYRPKGAPEAFPVAVRG